MGFEATFLWVRSEYRTRKKANPEKQLSGVDMVTQIIE